MSIWLNESKIIKSVKFFNSRELIIIVTISDVCIVDGEGNLQKTIKRLAIPRSVHVSPSESAFIILFSDNYAILYDCTYFEPISIVRGLSSQTICMKFSPDSHYLLYGTNNSLVVWSLLSSSIDTMTHNYKEISSFSIDWYGAYLYIGNFNG